VIVKFASAQPLPRSLSKASEKNSASISGLTLAKLSDENRDPSAQGDKVEEENGGTDVQPKTQEAIYDQVNREQNHADISNGFHDPNLLDRLRD
jgi:hypothetical protein